MDSEAADQPHPLSEESEPPTATSPLDEDPALADGEKEDDGDEAEEEEEKEEEQEEDGDGVKEGEEEEDAATEKKKRGRKRGSATEEEGTEDKKRRRRRASTATPVERPSRERKAVERFAAMSPRKASVSKTLSFKEGSGTKLKDIPNVSFKLSKRKVDENLKILHSILFGKKSNAHFLKRNILQFSGFVWSENEEKQKTKLKEKLEKYNKEKLLDFCEILDIQVRTTTKKEEISAKLMEFMESPHVTRDVVLAEKLEKGKKRKKSKGTRASGGESSAGKAKKQRKKSKRSVNEDEEQGADDDAKEESSDEDRKHSEEESEHEKSEEEEEDNQDDPAETDKICNDEQTESPRPSKIKKTDAPSNMASEDESSPPEEVKKGSSKNLNKGSKSLTKVKIAREKKPDKVIKSTSNSSPANDSKTRSASSSKSIRVNTSKKQTNDTTKKKENSSKKEPTKSEQKASTKKQGKSKSDGVANDGPSTEELHAVVAEILKKVDFNTATLADILRQLGAHFKKDLMDRKAEVKRIIEDVINSMSDEEEDEEEEDA